MRPDPILRSGRERTVPLTVPPRRDALVCLPADFGRRFTVSVDTEEAFDWTGPFCRDGHHNRAIAALPRFQQRMEAAGVKPLYLVNHAVAADPEAAAVLRSIHSGGKASVGTHLHPWNTPPFEERVTRRNSFAGNLPESLERAKLTHVHDAVAAMIGEQPTIFRAGRYGIGPNTGRLLVELGYRIDVSVRSRFDYRNEGGPSFLSFPPKPYWVGESALLEIPLSGTYVGGLFPGARFARLNAFLVRLGLLARVALTPEGVPIATARDAVRRLIDEDVRLFSLSLHSPSLVPANTPYTRTPADLEGLERWWDAMLDGFAREGIAPVGIEAIAVACREGRLERLPS